MYIDEIVVNKGDRGGRRSFGVKSFRQRSDLILCEHCAKRWLVGTAGWAVRCHPMLWGISEPEVTVVQ
jgi:hypothetical protein